MKGNVRTPVKRRTPRLVAALVVASALAVGGLWGYDRLRAVWLDQCVVRDFAAQVSITSGKMVKADVLAENFGLRPGANLARIDFAARRAQILDRIPNLRAITVVRTLPDRVAIEAEERVPVARMAVSGRRQATGRVVDAEGVVFNCQRGTAALPALREKGLPATRPGERLTGRAHAALRLLERCRDAEFLDLGVAEADIARRDYITLTLGDYARAKIAWEGMDEGTDASAADLDRRLRHLKTAVKSNIAAGAVVWNVTDPSGRVYADTKGIPNR